MREKETITLAFNDAVNEKTIFVAQFETYIRPETLKRVLNKEICDLISNWTSEKVRDLYLKAKDLIEEYDGKIVWSIWNDQTLYI